MTPDQIRDFLSGAGLAFAVLFFGTLTGYLTITIGIIAAGIAVRFALDKRDGEHRNLNGTMPELGALTMLLGGAATYYLAPIPAAAVLTGILLVPVALLIVKALSSGRPS